MRVRGGRKRDENARKRKGKRKPSLSPTPEDDIELGRGGK